MSVDPFGGALRETTDQIFRAWRAREQELGIRLEIDRIEWVGETGGDRLVVHFRPYDPMQHLGGEFG